MSSPAETHTGLGDRAELLIAKALQMGYLLGPATVMCFVGSQANEEFASGNYVRGAVSTAVVMAEFTGTVLGLIATNQVAEAATEAIQHQGQGNTAI